MNKNRPILSILSSASESATECLEEGRCPVHHDTDLPCPLCREEDTLWKKQKRQELRREWQMKEQQRRDHPEEWLSAIGVPKRYLSSSFDCFEGGTRLVVLCRELVPDPFSLLLWGGPGSGKTHLSVSILRERIRRGITDDRFVCEQDLLRDIREGYARGISEEEKAKKYMNAALWSTMT